MKLSVQFASCLLTASTFLIQAAHAVPVASSPANLVPRDDPTQAAPKRYEGHGSSCIYWREDDSDGMTVKIQCDKIGQGLKAHGSITLGQYVFHSAWIDNNSLGKVVGTTKVSSSSSLEELRFRIDFDTSGMPDMGHCDSTLIEIEHAIKNGWINSMTCSEISPYVQARAVLDIPGAFNQYSEWISTPGEVSTREREAWFGAPSGYTEWRVKE